MELIKNLVLPGVGQIFLVDDKLVSERDLGNNFFVEQRSLNERRSEVLIYLFEIFFISNIFLDYLQFIT